jgi:hypothetical protein
MSKWFPSPADFAREAITVIGGALIAAIIIQQSPALRDYIKAKWDGINSPTNPW